MNWSPKPATPSISGSPSAPVTRAPEKRASTPSWARTEAIRSPPGSSSWSRRKGSVQPWRVVKRPGTCSRGQVRSQVSALPVGVPKENAARPRGITRVWGTGRPRASAISRPKVLSPRWRLKRLGQEIRGVPGGGPGSSISQRMVCSRRYPRRTGWRLNSTRVSVLAGRAGRNP